MGIQSRDSLNPQILHSQRYQAKTKETVHFIIDETLLTSYNWLLKKQNCLAQTAASTYLPPM
jgi:hypothetical protein